MDEIDEMKVKTNFLKAFVSTGISWFLRHKGLNVDVSLDHFDLSHADGDNIKLKLSISGECAEDELMKLFK